MLEDSCFYSSVPTEAVTLEILNYVSFISLCCLLNKKKVKSFKQTVFVLEQYAVSKVTEC